MAGCFDASESIPSDREGIAFFQDMKKQALFGSEFKTGMALEAGLKFTLRVTVQASKVSEIVQPEGGSKPVGIRLVEVDLRGIGDEV
jgi:hypothetical protein